MKNNAFLPLTGLALVMMTMPAAAHDAGDWVVRAGLTTVDPKGNNGDLVRADDDTTFTFEALYWFSDRWGIEVLAAAPFEHDISLVDGPTVGSTRHLPPTISAVYSLTPDSGFQPYIGLGVNVTLFFDESTSGPLAGSDLDLDTSVGLAALIGADFRVSENWLVNVEFRYLDIDTDAKLDGTELETVEIDPFLMGVNVGFRF